MKRFLVIAVAACVMATMVLTPATAFAQVIVDDSWASGTRTSPPNDAGWWYSTSSSGIEVGVGYLGLVTGTSGRGIHGTFAAQTLGIGDTLTATFTLTTPATVTTSGGGGANFRIGLFDTTGHDLAQDLTASSGSPNAEYNNLNGYMMDFDVNPTTASTNIAFRERTNPSSGQLLASTSDYTSLSSGGGSYSFAANTTYTGVWSLTRTGADTLDLSGSLYQGATLLSTYTGSDSSGITGTFGALAFHANSNIFGSSNTPDTPDNGIEFSNIKIELTAIPEPSALALTLIGLAGLVFANHRRRH
jgi:PEP-CTERM motif